MIRQQVNSADSQLSVKLARLPDDIVTVIHTSDQRHPHYQLVTSTDVRRQYSQIVEDKPVAHACVFYVHLIIYRFHIVKDARDVLFARQLHQCVCISAA